MITQNQFPFANEPKPNLNFGLTLMLVGFLIVGSASYFYLTKDDRD